MTDLMMPPVPSSVTDTLVPAGDINLRILRAGSGQAVILLPGWTCSADFFVHQLTGLASDCDVIAVDPRGHGGSDKPLTGNNFAQRGDDLAALISSLDIDDVVVVGWSFGVLDALSYIRRHGTDRIAKLVLVDETPKVPADPNNADEWGEAPLAHDGIVAFLRAMIDTRTEFWTDYAKYMLGLAEDTPADHPDVARVVELGLQAPEYVAITTAADGLTSDFSAEAAATAAEKPTLFMARDDWAEPAEKWVKANMPQAEFDRIDVHMGFVTQPEAFNARLKQFIAG